MRSDEHGQPRLGAIWGVDGLDADGEIRLREEAADQALLA